MKTRTLNAIEVKSRFSEILDQVTDDDVRVLVERDDRSVAAIINVGDLERLDRYDRERNARFEGLSQISQAFADVPLAELESEVSRAIEETRKKMRAERVAVPKST